MTRAKLIFGVIVFFTVPGTGGRAGGWVGVGVGVTAGAPAAYRFQPPGVASFSPSVLRKNARLPSAETPRAATSNAPFPPTEPSESSVVTPASRTYRSTDASVSSATSLAAVVKYARAPSGDEPT